MSTVIGCVDLYRTFARGLLMKISSCTLKMPISPSECQKNTVAYFILTSKSSTIGHKDLTHLGTWHRSTSNPPFTSSVNTVGRLFRCPIPRLYQIRCSQIHRRYPCNRTRCNHQFPPPRRNLHHLSKSPAPPNLKCYNEVDKELTNNNLSKSWTDLLSLMF